MSKEADSICQSLDPAYHLRTYSNDYRTAQPAKCGRQVDWLAQITRASGWPPCPDCFPKLKRTDSFGKPILVE